MPPLKSNHMFIISWCNWLAGALKSKVQGTERAAIPSQQSGGHDLRLVPKNMAEEPLRRFQKHDKTKAASCPITSKPVQGTTRPAQLPTKCPTDEKPADQEMIKPDR